MEGRVTIVGILFALLVPASLAAGALPRRWQDGEILSRKTVSTGHAYVRKQYVYRVKAFGRSYLVVSDTALHLDLCFPIRFPPARGPLFIKEPEGGEGRAAILQAALNRARQ